MLTLLRRSAPAFAVLLCACASIPSQERNYYDSEFSKLKREAVPLVVDACILRSEIGASYVLRQASVDSGATAAEQAQKYLRSHGLASETVVAPFICGAAWFDQKAAPDLIAENKSAPTQSISEYPIPLAERIVRDSALSQAYRQLFAIAAKPPAEDYDPTQPQQFDLDAAQLAVLRRDLGANKVWVLEVGGVQVSAAKTIGIGMLTGMAGVLTFGVGVVLAPVDGMGQRLTLLDLEHSRILWQKLQPSRTGDPADIAAYDEKWIRTAFTPFIDPDAPQGGTASEPVGPQQIAIYSAESIAPEPPPALQVALLPTPPPAFLPTVQQTLPASAVIVDQRSIELREQLQQEARILRTTRTEMIAPTTAQTLQAAHSPVFRVTTARPPAIVGRGSIEIRDRPKKDAPVLRIPSIASVQCKSRLRNGEGDWCFLDAPEGRGWMREP